MIAWLSHSSDPQIGASAPRGGANEVNLPSGSWWASIWLEQSVHAGVVAGADPHLGQQAEQVRGERRTVMPRQRHARLPVRQPRDERPGARIGHDLAASGGGLETIWG